MWTRGWNCPEGLSQPSFVKFDPGVSVEKIIIWQANDDHRQTMDVKHMLKDIKAHMSFAEVTNKTMIMGV